MSTTVVTELIVKSDSAVTNTRAFTDAMGKADKAASDAIAHMTTGPNSFDGLTKSFQKLQASSDPVFASQLRGQQAVEKATNLATLAVSKGVATQAQADAVVAQVSAKYSALTENANKAAFAQTSLGKAFSPISAQLTAISAGAGPFSTFLVSLGPLGIAAAFGIGAIEAAMNAARESANKLATGAIEMRRFSEETGLASGELRALTAEAARHGVQSDETVGSIVKFTVALAQMRDGTGTLLTGIRKIDPALADQMQVTKNTASAFNLLSQAIAKADATGDVATRNALARAAGGKGGVSALLGIASTVSDAGGVENLAKQYGDAHVSLSTGLIDDVIRLRSELDENTKYADKLFASIGAKTVLEADLAWQKMRVTAAETAVAMAKAEESKGFWEWFFDKLAATSDSGAGMLAVHQLATSLTAVPVGKVTVGANLPDLTAQKTPQALSADSSRDISALGSAASAYERLNDRVLKLKADLDSNTISQQTYNRALAGANTDYSTAALTARISALGLMASQTDVATQATLRINKANQDGANVSPSQKALIVEAAQLQLSGTQLNTKASFGLASETDILNQKTAEYYNTISQLKASNDHIVLSNEQVAAGYQVVAQQAKAASDASKVAASAHPQLTQLTLDSGNLDKQLDTLAVGSLNDVTDALTSITTGTMATGDAFRNLGLSVVTALEKMIIQMTLIMPIATALQSVIKGVGGGFDFTSIFGGTASNGATILPSSAFVGPPLPSAMGNVFSGPGISAYSNSIVTRPTYFANGGNVMGEAGPEVIMPIRRGPDGRMGVSGAGGGQTTTVHYSPTIDARGADAVAVARLASALADDRKNFGKNVLTLVNKAQQNMQLG